MDGPLFDFTQPFKREMLPLLGAITTIPRHRMAGSNGFTEVFNAVGVVGVYQRLKRIAQPDPGRDCRVFESQEKALLGRPAIELAIVDVEAHCFTFTVISCSMIGDFRAGGGGMGSFTGPVGGLA